MEDRLEAMKARFERSGPVEFSDVDWLVEEVERLRQACKDVLAGFRYEKGRPVMAEWKMKEILEAAIRQAEDPTS